MIDSQVHDCFRLMLTLSGLGILTLGGLGCVTEDTVRVGQFVWVSDGSAATLNDIKAPIPESENSTIFVSAGPDCTTVSLEHALGSLDGRLRDKKFSNAASVDWKTESGGWVADVTETHGELRVYTSNEVSISGSFKASGGLPVSGSSSTTSAKADLLIVHYRRRVDVSNEAQRCLASALLEQRCEPGRSEESPRVLGRVLTGVLYGGLLRTGTNQVATANRAQVKPGEFVEIELAGAVKISGGKQTFLGNFVDGHSLSFDALNSAFTAGDPAKVATAFEQALSAYALIGFAYREVTTKDCPTARAQQ